MPEDRLAPEGLQQMTASQLFSLGERVEAPGR